VAVDADGSPVSVSWSGDARRNIIVWMDHRAVNQAERINSSKSPVLQYCGGALSPEMQAPKVSIYINLLFTTSLFIAYQQQ
jgi:ribulose kinase